MNEYLKRFNALVATTKLTDRENIWYCDKLYNKTMKNATNVEIKYSEEKMKAVFFFIAW